MWADDVMTDEDVMCEEDAVCNEDVVTCCLKAGGGEGAEILSSCDANVTLFADVAYVS